MKTSVWDYLWSSLVIAAVLAVDLALVAFGVVPLTRRWLGAYHVLADLAAATLCYGLLSGLVLRAMLALHPLPRGEFDMDAGVFAYWKLLTVVYRLGQGALRPLTPIFLKPLVEVLFGAKVGADVALGGTIDDPYLVTLGDSVILGNASLVSGNAIANGKSGSARCALSAVPRLARTRSCCPVRMSARRHSSSPARWLSRIRRIPPGETWRGNPARKWM